MQMAAQPLRLRQLGQGPSRWMDRRARVAAAGWMSGPGAQLVDPQVGGGGGGGVSGHVVSDSRHLCRPKAGSHGYPLGAEYRAE